MASALPHHRHQSSLEDVIDFSARDPLSHEQRVEMDALLSKLLTHCRQANAEPRPYKWVDLLQLIRDYAVSEAGRGHFLHHILTSAAGRVEQQDSPTDDTADVLLTLADFETWSESRKEEVIGRLQVLADNLINCFFIPFRAVGRRTPQPTPLLMESGGLTPVGVTKRLSNLRAKCLLRDHHRCVITRSFDRNEAESRSDRDGKEAKDDDGYLLENEGVDPMYLEVSHIIPHSLLSKSAGETELNDSKRYVLQVLNMFDPGIANLIDSGGIDRPFNAMTLTVDMHRRFGALKVYFEPPPAELKYPEHTYIIRATKPYTWQRNPSLPLERTLLLSPNRTIDPPSQRLLAVHRACALILHLSGAAEYISQILQDEDEGLVKSDGSTELGRILASRVGGCMRYAPAAIAT